MEEIKMIENNETWELIRRGRGTINIFEKCLFWGPGLEIKIGDIVGVVLLEKVLEFEIRAIDDGPP